MACGASTRDWPDPGPESSGAGIVRYPSVAMASSRGSRSESSLARYPTGATAAARVFPARA